MRGGNWYFRKSQSLKTAVFNWDFPHQKTKSLSDWVYLWFLSFTYWETTNVDGSEIRRSPVEVGSFSMIFIIFVYIQQVVVWDSFHQQLCHFVLNLHRGIHPVIPDKIGTSEKVDLPKVVWIFHPPRLFAKKPLLCPPGFWAVDFFSPNGENLATIDEGCRCCLEVQDTKVINMSF